MRVTLKLSASLLAGILAILVVDALLAWRREVDFFHADMCADHELVGDFVAAVVRRTWQREGREQALEVPRSIDEGNRHLSLRWVEDVGLVPASLQNELAAGATVSLRDTNLQRTFVPIRGADGERLVLEVRESLAPERHFSDAAFTRAGLVAAAVLGVSALVTVVLGVLWVGRPMRALCLRAARIGAGQFDVGAAAARGDEFGTLARAMDDMARSLAGARDRIERATAQRVAALEQLRHADRLATVGQLAAGVAHELGTPLNVVWSLAGMIEKGEIQGAELTESAHSIGEAAAQMTAIIRQLLDFARPRRPDKVALDLGGAAEHALQLLEVMAQKRGVALRLERAGPCRARFDPSQLQQVLTNLVVNAIQASRRGDTVCVRVGPATAPPPQHVASAAAWQRLDVVDTGVGIAPGDIDRLFEPFFTTKGVGEGTGLGLSVARGIVHENGGCIAVASEPGKGSCFTVHLPAAEDA